MKLVKEIHCHTVYSHGTGTIEDNVTAAIEKGVDTIIISEHGPGHYFARKNTVETYAEMRDEILRLREKYPEIEIFMGLEANIISTKGDLDVSDELLKLLDYLYCGIHLMSIPKNISSFFNMQIMNTLCSKFGWFKKRQTKINTRAVCLAMDKYPLTMITHPDTRGPIDLLAVARKAEEKNVILEINDTKCKLNADDIKRIEDSGINVTFAVGSDAHSRKDICKWENARKILEESGVDLKKVWNVE